MRIVTVCTLCALMLLPGCTEQRAEPECASSPASRALVRVSPVQQGSIYKAYRAVGTVAPEDLARIMPKVSGRIEKIAVEEGDPVSAGQTLMQMDTFDYARNRENAAALARQTRASLDKARRDLKRMKKLYASRAVSEQVFQDARTAYEVTRFAADQTAAGLDLSKRNLSECTVRSPIDGMVTQRFVNEGELVAPQIAAFVIMQMNTVKVEVDLPEEAFGFVARGNPGVVHADAIPGRRFTGTITKIYPTIDPVSRTFKVTVSITNPELVLRAGMTARTEVVEKAREDTLYAPLTALIPGEDGYYVYRIRGEMVEKVPVKVGIMTDEVMEITAGITAGDHLVTTGLTGLRDGMEVEVQNDPSHTVEHPPAENAPGIPSSAMTPLNPVLSLTTGTPREA